MQEQISTRASMEEFYWWHSIRLDDGRITPGHKSFAMMSDELQKTFGPLDLTGKSVLDVGAWNGGFSIEAKRRNAGRVVAVDHSVWNAPHLRGRESFDFATRSCGCEIEGVELDMDAPRLDLAPLGTFDVVLFLGVFYHLVDPVAALREVAACTSQTLVLETYLDPSLEERPAMAFYPGAELNNDPTNWWGPNRACIEGLLRLNGFKRITHIAGSLPERGVFHAYR